AMAATRMAAAEPLGVRVAEPMLRALAALGRRLTPAGSRVALETRLALAGIHGPSGRQAVLAVLALTWAIGLAAGWAAAAIRPALGLVVGGSVIAVGITLPRLVLDSLIRRRRQEITLELPDSLDLLTASVEAGLGFDAAVMRVAGRPTRERSPLREELQHYLTDARLGRARAEALRDLAERTGVPDLATVTAALIQADQLGVGISAVLRAQALQLRTRRRQRAQAAALQAPVKMLFPLVFFVFPAMFIVTLGPAALRMIDTFTKVGH
ncbi:MAG: type II secretion system F family protein, partial [Candidatus Sericytochromatia bacterium]|nr:type II secretion system F family protein [Candidatus Tanganyikabacteria bacterium]